MYDTHQKKKPFISLNNIKQLVFVPDMQCVFCEIEIKYYLDEFQASGG
jgi:hypothetical protein